MSFLKKTIFTKRAFLLSLLGFILLNCIFYLFLFYGNNIAPINKAGYEYQAHHYFPDPKFDNQPFQFLRGLGGWDGQWYLRIADAGYPIKLNQYMGSPTYAFFPFYPLILFVTNGIFHNIELTAFIVTSVLLLVDFISFYYIVTKLYSSQMAIRALFLFYTFPFSLFYRSYYTEGIFLFLIMWFGYFLIQKKWFLSALLLSFICVTRPNGPFFALIFLWFIYKALRRKEISLKKVVLYITMSSIWFFSWLYFCYLQTGDSLYWYHVQSLWYKPSYFLSPIIENLGTIFSFFTLENDFNHSKSEICMIFLVSALLIFSRKKIKPELWWISFLIFIFPLLFKNIVSYSRYQSISFPLFLYAAMFLKGRSFIITISINGILLFMAGLAFINWNWVG